MTGRFDLVTIFEALHDMSRPVDALRAARGMLSEAGAVVIADELVEDEFTAPASDLERYHYGWSVVSCLPAAMGDPHTAPLRPGGRLPRRGGPPAGDTGLAFLPADPMSAGGRMERRARGR